jgi:O-antigen/teichoic acid export membrane protein
VSGVLGGVILSTFIIVVVTYIILRRSLKLKGDDLVNKKHLSLKSAMPVLLANTTFVIMTQIDMVVVNYYFSEQDVGLYAAASILGKAVMYLPGGIAMALFPMVAENQAHGKSSVNLIFQAVGITALLCMLGAVFYFLFSDFTITFLYGIEYKEAANILKYFGFAIFPMALIMVAEYFLIAMGRVLFAYLFMVVTPLQLVGFYYYHDTLLEIVTVLFISGMALAFSGYGILWRAFKVEKTATKI